MRTVKTHKLKFPKTTLYIDGKALKTTLRWELIDYSDYEQEYWLKFSKIQNFFYKNSTISFSATFNELRIEE